MVKRGLARALAADIVSRRADIRARPISVEFDELVVKLRDTMDLTVYISLISIRHRVHRVAVLETRRFWLKARSKTCSRAKNRG